jgi:hypothetical protein
MFIPERELPYILRPLAVIAPEVGGLDVRVNMRAT